MRLLSSRVRRRYLFAVRHPLRTYRWRRACTAPFLNPRCDSPTGLYTVGMEQHTEYPHWWDAEGKCEWCGWRSTTRQPLPAECPVHRQQQDRTNR